MPGPPPKDAKTRARRNKKSTATTLTAPDKPVIPELPDSRKWHARTVQWWTDLWSSPMSSQYLPTDVDSLVLIAFMRDDGQTCADQGDSKGLSDISKELRMQEQRFGLSPLDRARLHWAIEENDGKEKPKRPERPTFTEDPRRSLGSDAVH